MLIHVIVLIKFKSEPERWSSQLKIATPRAMSLAYHKNMNVFVMSDF